MTFILSGPVDVVITIMFGLQQQDAHVMLWRFIRFHYGTVENWIACCNSSSGC